MVGGKILEESHFNYQTQPMTSGMTRDQMNRLEDNQDLRKKLRIDRMKKMN